MGMPFNINDIHITRGSKFRLAVLDYQLELTPEIESIEINFSIDGLASGFFYLNDIDFNFHKQYMLVGGEYLMFTLYSQYSNNTIINKLFRVTNVITLNTELNMGNTKSRYKIFFDSYIVFANALNDISKGYVDPITTSEIVLDMLTSKLNLESDKNLFNIIQSNVLLEKHVITWSHPLEVIEQMKILSGNNPSKDFYVFYEDLVNFKFMPLSMLTGLKPVFKLDRQSISGDVFKEGVPVLKIEEDTFVSGIKVLESIKNEGLGITKSYFDIVTKELVDTEYIFNKDFMNNMTTLGENSYYKEYICNSAGKSTYKTTTAQDMYEEGYIYYNMRKQLFNFNRLKATLSGSLNINIGSTVYIEFPQNSNELDSCLTGNWLVTNMSLKFSNQGGETNAVASPHFKMDIILCKDAFGSLNKTMINPSLLKIDSNVNK